MSKDRIVCFSPSSRNDTFCMYEYTWVLVTLEAADFKEASQESVLGH